MTLIAITIIAIIVLTAWAYAIATSYAPKNANFKALKCDTYWRAPFKEGDAYVKERRIMQMKFQNLVIVSFQITINSCCYDIYSHIFHNY